MVELYTSSLLRVACAADIKKNRENRKRVYEGQIEGSYPVESFERERGPIQSNEKIHIQVSVEEVPQNTQEEYPKNTLYTISAE